MIRSAIEETAAAGESVIVGHAASAALKGREGVLRVLVTASDETRRERISAERGVDGKQAAKVVHESDAARADYLKRFYGIHEELPVQYDLVLNTDNLSTARAAAIVVSAANA
jgi:cytidylate kinase